MKKLIAIAMTMLLVCLSLCALAETEETYVDPLGGLSDTWVLDGATVEIFQDEDGVISAHGMINLSEEEDYRWEYGTCEYDAEANTLTCSDGVKTHNTYADGAEEMTTEVVSTDCTAVFSLNEEDQLIWADSEGLAEGMAFLRLEVSQELYPEDTALTEDGAEAEG